MNGTRAALKRMVPRDRGHPSQVGSALAHHGRPLQAAYCGVKHAVLGFTEGVQESVISELLVSMVDVPAPNTIQFTWVTSSLPHPAVPCGRAEQDLLVSWQNPPARHP